MEQKIVKLKAKLAGTLYELIVNTRIDNVEMLDGTLLADKLQEIVNAINVRDKITDVNAKIETAKSQTEAKAQQYTDQQISLVSQTGIPKLMVYPLSSTATTEGQTVFDIDLDNFDKTTDTVFVQSGRTMLFPNSDFEVVDNTVVLKEGAPLNRTIGIYVFKNVPMGEEGSVSGGVIAPNSLPLDRLERMPNANEVGALPNTGGTVDGEINVIRSEHENNTQIFHYGGNTYIRNHDGKGVSSDLYFGLDQELRYKTKDGITHALYGTHHKPTASDVGAVPTSKLETDFVKITHQKMTTNGDERVISCYYLTDTMYWRVDVQRTCTNYRLFDNGNIICEYKVEPNKYITNTGGTVPTYFALNIGSGTIEFFAPDKETKVRLIHYNDKAYTRIMKDTSNYSDLTVGLNVAPRYSGVKSGSGFSYALFGEHNKPTGSYTGNGSATARTINIGGIGGTLRIAGYGCFGIVTSQCAVFVDSSGTILKEPNVTFSDGVLNIASSNHFVNANGSHYGWELL